MREIKTIGRKKQGSHKYLFSIFQCPNCLEYIEKIRKDGLKAKYCSHKCYAENRGLRGAYKDSVIISGYRYLQKPNHPNCTKKGYVAEHRLVAEEKIGRYLSKNEDVHHINENKLDNRAENLMVLSKSDHMKLHKSKNFTPCEITE